MNRDSALVLVLASNLFYGCASDLTDTGRPADAGAEESSQNPAEKTGKRQIISITSRPPRVTKDENGVERMGVDVDVTVEER
jgi:hypothetical protein